MTADIMYTYHMDKTDCSLLAMFSPVVLVLVLLQLCSYGDSQSSQGMKHYYVQQ